MTTDRDFDRIATAWLADGPDELPGRVIDAAVDQIHLTRQRRAVRAPWRFPTMTSPIRLAALAAAGVLILAAVAMVGGAGRSGPSPTQAPPSVLAAVPSAAVPVLDTQFISPRNGYSITYPAGWTVRPATQSWQPGKPILWGDATLDAIQTSQARFVAAGQRLATGETAAQWLKAYCLGAAKDTGQCDTVPQSWVPIKIAGSDAYIDLNGVPAAPGTITPGGKVFDAVVVSGITGWAFTLDGEVDRPMFDAFLDKVYLLPATLISIPELTGRFTSPTLGYSIGTAADWTTTPATTQTRTAANPYPVDQIRITGTDSVVSGWSEVLPKGGTFAAYLVAKHQDALAGNPPGCDGGDPSTWPSIPIGSATGRLQMWCNAAVAFVEAGGRAYTFGWGSDTFQTDQHFSFEAWKELLTSVVLDPASAK